MLRIPLIFISIGLTILMCNSSAIAAPLMPVEIPPSAINVRNFGARGDGKSDDTQAIQAAVNAAQKRGEAQSLNVRHYRPPHQKDGIVFKAHPEIIFPPGTYRISKPIVFLRYALVHGVGNAVITQADSTQDIFYFHTSVHSNQSCLFSVENLHFQGGKIQLRFFTNNCPAQISVERCTFANSSDYAVECRSYTQKKLEGSEWRNTETWQPYAVKWQNGQPQLTPNDAHDLEMWYNSTLFSMAHCRIENCRRAVDMACDTGVIRDSTITANPQADGPIFNFPSRQTYLYRINGNVHPTDGKLSYWIEGGGILAVRHSDFTSSAGMDFVRISHSPTEAYNVAGRCSLILTDCNVNTAESAHNALVWLGKDCQPNILSITGITETSGKNVNAVVWEDESALNHLADFSTSFNSLRLFRDTPLADQYKIQISHNSPNIETNIPDQLKAMVENSPPQIALDATFVPEIHWSYRDLEIAAWKTGKVLLAENFGLDTNPESDDTTAIQKVFDTAAKEGFCQVIFPAGVFKISHTIQVPAQIAVRGAGTTAFEQANPDIDLFQIKNAQKVGFKNCLFESGRYGINIMTSDAAKAQIAFDGCWISDQLEGIHCMTGAGKEGEANHTELLFQRGILNARQAVVTNAAHTQVDTFWIYNGVNLANQGCLENRGGAMRVQNMLSVPGRYSGNKMFRDVRWFDNWGQFYSLDNRFGGEADGICAIYNRSNTGTVFVGGGFSRFYNPSTQKTLLYMEQSPASAVLQNVATIPNNSVGKFAGSAIVMAAPGIDIRHVFMTGILTPSVKESM